MHCHGLASIVMAWGFFFFSLLHLWPVGYVFDDDVDFFRLFFVF
jgi:hypothetical protein